MGIASSTQMMALPELHFSLMTVADFMSSAFWHAGLNGLPGTVVVTLFHSLTFVWCAIAPFIHILAVA